jgi:hypothetical protein
LTRAAEADGTQPKGIFYYMENDDVRSLARREKFPAAIAELRGLGLKVELERGVIPQGESQILGLTTGSAKVPLATSRSRFAPGTLVDNLTSGGGYFARHPNAQTRISEYLRLGAAGGSGAVVEPFAIAEKFPVAQLHVHYAHGCSLAESFYQSVQGPFQLIIVGDPLCQPWAKIPQVSVAGVTPNEPISGEVELTPTAKTAPGQTVRRFQLFVDGAARQICLPGQTLKLDTTKLADGYHELRVVAVDDSPIETEGRWIGEALVSNGRNAVALTITGGDRVSTPQLSLTVTSTVDGVTAVHHNGREIGRVTGRRGKLEIPIEKLGKGPVTLQAITVAMPGLRSRPLVVEVL